MLDSGLELTCAVAIDRGVGRRLRKLKWSACSTILYNTKSQKSQETYHVRVLNLIVQSPRDSIPLDMDQALVVADPSRRTRGYWHA